MALRSVQGARILLTGASSGIGWHLALQFAEQGAHVLATARRRDRLDQLRSRFASVIKGRSPVEPLGSIECLTGDLTDGAHRSAMVDWCRERWGALDCLVNNAGVGAIGKFSDASSERLRHVMEVNFFAPVELTRIALPLLKAGNRSAIVVIGSVLGHRAVPTKSEYCASKFALRGWTEALRCELSSQSIEVVMVSPSTTQTEFFDSLVESTPVTKSASLGKMTAEKVAKATLSAWQRGRRDSILSPAGKILVWAAGRFPRITDQILSRFAK